LVFFLAGFLASRLGAFLFAMLKVYAIGQTVQDPFGKLTTTLNPSNLPDFGASGYNLFQLPSLLYRQAEGD
jgi:hypothetical protein